MSTEELNKYVAAARQQGIGDEEIKKHLLDAGWSEQEVVAVLVPQPISQGLLAPPVPQKAHFDLWVAFQYVLLFISLYVSSIALNGILHYGIDQLLPDTLEGYGSYRSSWNEGLIKWYLAAMIVAFPIFAVLFLLLKRQELAKPAMRNIKSRKILIYLTLIGTFLIAMARLIISLYRFLDGTLTGRTVAHLALTLALTGSIFVYWLWEVRADRKANG